MSFCWDVQQQLQTQISASGGSVPPRETRSIKLRRMEIGGEIRNVSIRLVETSERIEAACHLINDRYSWRGYGSDHRIPADAYHMTFTAEVDDEVVGTITLAVDSEHGLAADRAFEDDINQFRAIPGRRVCELTKFAFGSTIKSKELMAALFHIVFIYGHRTHGSTDLFIEVNPRHVRFYETMLGFERVGPVKTNDSVAAPAQLMWLKVAAIRDFIDECAGSGETAHARSLYPFFFSPTEENGIYRRLARAEKAIKPLERDGHHSDMDAAAFLDSLRLGSHGMSAASPAPPDHQLATH